MSLNDWLKGLIGQNLTPQFDGDRVTAERMRATALAIAEFMAADTPFSTEIPFNRQLSYMGSKQVEPNMAFTISTADRVPGFKTMVRLIGNDLDIPNFSAFKVASGSQDFIFSAGIPNVIEFWWDGVDYWMKNTVEEKYSFRQAILQEVVLPDGQIPVGNMDNKLEGDPKLVIDRTSGFLSFDYLLKFLQHKAPAGTTKMLTVNDAGEVVVANIPGAGFAPTFTAVQEGHVVKYLGGVWKNSPDVGLAVNTTNLLTGDSVKWDGTKWVNYTPPAQAQLPEGIEQHIIGGILAAPGAEVDIMFPLTAAQLATYDELRLIIDYITFDTDGTNWTARFSFDGSTFNVESKYRWTNQWSGSDAGTGGTGQNGQTEARILSDPAVANAAGNFNFGAIIFPRPGSTAQRQKAALVDMSGQAGSTTSGNLYNWRGAIMHEGLGAPIRGIRFRTSGTGGASNGMITSLKWRLRGTKEIAV